MNGAGRVERYSLTSESANLAPMRAWLRERLERHPLSSSEREALVLAVGELCANSIKHAYDSAPGQPILVSVDARDDRVVVHVEDFGAPFDRDAYAPPDLESAPERGLGILIARHGADRLTYRPGRTRGTRWTLVKYVPGRPPAPAAASPDLIVPGEPEERSIEIDIDPGGFSP